MHDQVNAQKEPTMGKVMHMYDWRASYYYPCFDGLHVILVSKATLDIICETAFGYKTDSLHNPENELAVAYERLLALQNGKLTKRRDHHWRYIQNGTSQNSSCSYSFLVSHSYWQLPGYINVVIGSIRQNLPVRELTNVQDIGYDI